MALHRISIPSSSFPKAFTLIEILIVSALFLSVAGLGLFVSMDTYRSSGFRNERDIIVNALAHARSKALANSCSSQNCTRGGAHGVYFGTPGQYVVFEGSTYASRDPAADEIILAEDEVTQVSGFSEVIFSPRSGNAEMVGDVELRIVGSAASPSSIVVNPEGRIDWTN